MNVWVCRILAVIFFLNTLPVEVCAQRAPKKLDPKSLEAQVNKKSVEELRNQEKVELERELQAGDLSPRERKFIELELEIVNTEIECLERQCDAASVVMNQIPEVYAPRLETLRARQEMLEKEEAINDFYQQAQTLPWIGAAVGAMHSYAEHSNELIAEQDQKFTAAKDHLNKLDISSGNLVRAVQFMSSNSSTPTKYLSSAPGTIDIGSFSTDIPARIDVLKLWEDDEITLEDLIELIDPVGQKVSDGTSDAAKLLHAIFYSFNLSQERKLAQTEEEKDNALWIAKRLKYRVTHELFRLKGFVEVRANLMLLLLQVDKFLNTYNKETEEQKTKDRTMAGYDMIVTELNNGLTLSRMWEAGVGDNVFQDLMNEVKQKLASEPNQDSVEFEQLRRNLSTLVIYAILQGEDIFEIVPFINKDGKEYRGYHEAFVTEFFTSVYDAIVNFQLSYAQQEIVRNMIRKLAAPEFNYKGKKYKNAVNMRVQALSLASVLRVAADTHAPYTLQDILGGKGPREIQIPHLAAELFTDSSFRQAMAAYTIDVYAPTTTWNAAAMGFKDGQVEQYGLTLGRTRETDEVTQLSDHLASLFASFLPVLEPTSISVKQVTGMYRGCEVRSVGSSPQMLTSLSSATGSSYIQEYAVDEEGRATNVKCPGSRYGDPSTILVTDSEGTVRSILRKKAHPAHAYRVDRDFAESILWEAFTWFLWGAAFKVIAWGVKAGRAAIVATRAIAKGTVAEGMKAARWQSKFSQVWKYSTKSWQSEAGIVEGITKEGGNYVVELARPGFKSIKVLVPTKGVSLRTLKGRVAFRRALRREIEGMSKSASKTGRSTTAKTIDQFRRPLTKAEQEVVKDEQVLVKAVKQELKNGRSFEKVEEGGVSLYRPANGNPYINPRTGIPEHRLFDTSTGNLYGVNSGKYMGTVAGDAAGDTAYGIALGLARDGGEGVVGSLSPAFTGRYLWARYPILPEGWGLTKMVATFRVTDPIIYQLGLKPWQEKVAKEQDEYLLKKHGVDQKGLAEGAPSSMNALEQAQNMGVVEQELFYASRFATISGAFVGLNNALNNVLPQWVIDARRGLFGWTTSVSSVIDRPFEKFLPKSVTELAPTPGAALMLYPMLASDPTPNPQQDGTAADEQYRRLAENQRLQRSLDGHDAKEYQKSLDKQIKLMQDNFEENLKAGTEIAMLLSALPSGKKEMKTVQQVYIQKLREVRQLAETDLVKAQKLEEDASKIFLNTQADIMKRAIHAFLENEKAAVIPNQIEIFNKNWNPSDIAPKGEKIEDAGVAKARLYFRSEHKSALVNILNDYYKKKEQYLVDFHTAPSQSLKTNQDVDALQKTAQRNLEQLEKELESKIHQLENTLSSESLSRQIDAELDTINGDEEVIGSLKYVLLATDEGDLVRALPDGEKALKQAYKTYEQMLKEAKKIVKENPEKAEKIFDEAVEKLINTRTDIVCECVTVTSQHAREMEVQAEVESMTVTFGIFFTPQDQAQLEKLINDYWTNYETGWIEFFKAQARSLLDPKNKKIPEEQEIILSRIEQLEKDFTTQKEKLEKAILQRAKKYSNQGQ